MVCPRCQRNVSAAPSECETTENGELVDSGGFEFFCESICKIFFRVKEMHYGGGKNFCWEKLLLEKSVPNFGAVFSGLFKDWDRIFPGHFKYC